MHLCGLLPFVYKYLLSKLKKRKTFLNSVHSQIIRENYIHYISINVKLNNITSKYLSAIMSNLLAERITNFSDQETHFNTTGRSKSGQYRLNPDMWQFCECVSGTFTCVTNLQYVVGLKYFRKVFFVVHRTFYFIKYLKNLARYTCGRGLG